MGLEKMGLPPKPYEKGKDWTPDSTNCEGCQATFTWINRKHHCRRCGGLFCNNCTLSRQYLRGQGDAPARVCEPCKQIEEAAKFELRYGKSKTPRGGTKASSKDDGTDTLLKQLLKPDGKSQDEVNVESILASVADTDSDEHELASPSKETAPVDPARLHEQAQEEKKRYSALKKQGKDAEALKAFKRAKELERQAEAREKEIRHQRRASVGSSSQLVGQHSKLSPSKEDPGSPDTQLSSLSTRKSELGENLKKRRASSQDQVKEKASTSEKDDFLQELKSLGWSDKEIREADKKPAAKSEEQLLAELAAEVRPKSDRAETRAAPGDAMSAQIMAHKRQALVLKREGRLAEAKEELRKAKLLEKQAEEMTLLGQIEGEDEASDDDDLMALIRRLEKEEKSKGNAGKGGASQSTPEDFALFPSFVDDDDDAHVEVDDDDLDDPEMVAALRAMGWEEEAAGLERTSKPQSKLTKPTQLTGPNLKEQILARKRKALAFKREGKIAEARAELGEAKKLEQQLEKLESVVTPSSIVQAPVQVPMPAFDISDDKIEESEDKVEVTDEDMRDPEMMAALRAMGFGDESSPSDEVIAAVTKDNTVEIATLNQDILGLKRQALALKREGRVNEAREALRRAKVLEQQLQDLQAVPQRQEETPELIKESRAMRRGAQALPVLSGLPNFDDEAEEENVEVNNADLVDPDIAAALAAVGWQDDPADKSTDLLVTVPKNDGPSPKASVVSDPVPENLRSVGELQPQKVEIKESEPTPGTSAKSVPSPATSNHVFSTKTKSQLQQELLGRKRRALAFKRERKSEEARIELQEAKIIEQQLAELEKGLAVIPPAVAEPKPGAAVQTDHPPPRQASVHLLKQDPEPSRLVYLDDEPVNEVEVTDDDMQDPALLAALAGMGWQGDKEVTGPSKSTPVLEKSSTTGEKVSIGGIAKPLGIKSQTGKGGDKMEKLLEFDWGDPLWYAKKTGKEMGTKGVNKEQVVNSSQKDEEENPFEGKYGEIGQTMDLVPPLLDHAGPKVIATPSQHRSFWQSGFTDLLSRDRFKPNQINEQTSAIKDSQLKIPSAHNELIGVDEEDVEDVMDPKLMAALKGLGITPSEISSKKETTHSKGESQRKDSGSRVVLPPPPQVTSKPPERQPPILPSTKPNVVSVTEVAVSVQPAALSLQQEILAHKRKALALKREGKAGDAREELRKAKLLERQTVQQGSEAIASASTVTSAGMGNASAHGKVEEVFASTAVIPSRLEPLNPVKTSPPSKGPAHKEEMQKQVRQTKDRMKLQQESLAHKRKAMGLRREGKIDEADAEYELAKNLEQQMEDLDPMHGKEDLGDVAGVDELLDPQLLAALKGVGFREGELAGASGPRGPVKTLTGVTGQPRSDVSSSSRTSLAGTVAPSKLAGGALEAEKKQLEEQIRAQKLQAVQLKRAGKQGEALEKLRGAKQLEKRLLALTS